MSRSILQLHTFRYFYVGPSLPVLQSRLQITRVCFVMKTHWIDQVNLFRDFCEMIPDEKGDDDDEQARLAHEYLCSWELNNGKALEAEDSVILWFCEVKRLQLAKTSISKYAWILLEAHLECLSKFIEVHKLKMLKLLSKFRGEIRDSISSFSVY